MPRAIHRESHPSQRIGWLRAAVLGANDGIVSTASLMVGVAAIYVKRGPPPELAARVVVWRALAMALTAGAGKLFGAAV